MHAVCLVNSLGSPNLLRGSSQNINPHILGVDVLEVDILGVRVDILGVDILRLTPVELGSY